MSKSNQQSIFYCEFFQINFQQHSVLLLFLRLSRLSTSSVGVSGLSKYYWGWNASARQLVETDYCFKVTILITILFCPFNVNFRLRYRFIMFSCSVWKIMVNVQDRKNEHFLLVFLVSQFCRLHSWILFSGPIFWFLIDSSQYKTGQIIKYQLGGIFVRVIKHKQQRTIQRRIYSDLLNMEY